MFIGAFIGLTQGLQTLRAKEVKLMAQEVWGEADGMAGEMEQRNGGPRTMGQLLLSASRSSPWGETRPEPPGLRLFQEDA